jgi:hypothetical protein
LQNNAKLDRPRLSGAESLFLCAWLWEEANFQKSHTPCAKKLQVEKAPYAAPILADIVSAAMSREEQVAIADSPKLMNNPAWPWATEEELLTRHREATALLRRKGLGPKAGAWSVHAIEFRKLLVTLLIILTMLGLIVPAIGKVRSAGNVMRCQSNMRQIVIACHNYHNDWGHIPIGTVRNTELVASRRLSWLTQIWPYIEAGPKLRLEKSEPWDSQQNCPIYTEAFRKGEFSAAPQVVGNIPLFFCPANGVRNGPSLPCPTHFIGIAGFGPDAAELPLTDRRCGIFGYDRRVSMQDFKDGTSTTLALSEVLDGGPWTAGGRATVRGLVVGEQPYLGEGGQFTSTHRTAFFLGTRPDVNVAFADCSVRRLTATMSPQIFEALATIAGGEPVDELP